MLFTVEATIFTNLPYLTACLGWFVDCVRERWANLQRRAFNMGINRRQRLFMEIRLASNGVYHAVVIGLGRAIAEVGAAIMVGGNIAGKTRDDDEHRAETSKGTWGKRPFWVSFAGAVLEFGRVGCHGENPEAFSPCFRVGG